MLKFQYKFLVGYNYILNWKVKIKYLDIQSAHTTCIMLLELGLLFFIVKINIQANNQWIDIPCFMYTCTCFILSNKIFIIFNFLIYLIKKNFIKICTF